MYTFFTLYAWDNAQQFILVGRLARHYFIEGI